MPKYKTTIRKAYEAHVEENDAEDIPFKGKYKMQKQIVEGGKEMTMPVFKDVEHEKQFNEEMNALMETEFMMAV